MKLTLQRISDNGESTIGALYINGKFACWTIEDTRRDQKIAGETRIPAGIYKMDLRKEGGKISHYRERFGSEHDGMLWLKNVPGFKYIYIHVGNTAKDSEGCILLGDMAKNNSIGTGFIGESTNAYGRLYSEIQKSIKSEYTYIEVKDETIQGKI